MKQLIIARKDLQMSPGKLAAQVSHASMAFITWPWRQLHLEYGFPSVSKERYYIEWEYDADIMDDWICGSFTKVICEAKNKYQLEKVIDVAASLGLKEGTDYFLIKDNCLTELEPEETDGRTLTCIGFRPLDDNIVHQLSKKYQLYH